MLRRASILDYQRDTLCPDIWLADTYMRPAVKEFILSSIEGFFEDKNIKGYHQFIVDLWVGSSLASYFYKEDTDFDIKVIMDMAVFKKYNDTYADITSADIIDSLISAGRSSFWTTGNVPDTYHSLDLYFYDAKDAIPIHYMKYDSLYSIFNNTWYKEPKKLPKGLSPAYVLNQAKQKAEQFIEKLDRDILETKRDTIDFIILHDYLKNMDVDDLKDFSVYFKDMFSEVNKSISMLVKDRQLIKDLRTDVFDRDTLNSDLSTLMGSINYSDENIVFKLLQRYGYMRILTEISELFKTKGISVDNIPEYYKALS